MRRTSVSRQSTRFPPDVRCADCDWRWDAIVHSTANPTARRHAARTGHTVEIVREQVTRYECLNGNELASETQKTKG